MTESWREWEGRTVDGKFVLGDYLGGSDGCGVFRTCAGNGEEADAAIKLVAVEGAEAESQLRRWKAASELKHPNLIRILAVGRAAVEGRELVYAVDQFAEENLAQVIPERALTAEEARGMLGPVLDALEFVHGKGLVHGRIRPSNILAAGDQVKLSSDSLRVAGEVPRAVSALYDAPEVAANGISAASDVWSLGITLVETLTQRVPVWDAARMSSPEVGDNVTEPFRGIAQRCLQVDPATRCGIREIRELLEPARTPVKAAPVEAIAAAQQRPSFARLDSRRRLSLRVLALAAMVAVAIFLILRPRSARGPTEVQTSSVPPQAVQSAPAQQPQAQSRKAQSAVAQTAAAAPGGGERTVANDEIVERVMPQVTPSAQRTIEGRVKVRVKLKVDAAGKVTEAALKDAGPSKYFARVALEAARRWKFAPAPDENGREWTLFFVFTRARTEASVAHAR